MVNVLISADSKFPINRAEINAAVQSVLKDRGVSSNVEVSVLVCGARKSRQLALQYLKDDKPHNVLSFPTESFPQIGDIVVCYPLAQEEANRDNVLVDTKVSELVAHGVLHLLGENHSDNE